MDAFVKANAVVRVRRRWLPIVGPVASCVAILVTGWLMGPDVVFVLLAAMASFMAVHGLWRRWPIVHRGMLHVDREGVRVGSRPIAMRCTSGRVESRGARTFVRFDRYMSRVEVEVSTVGEGVLLLSALGITAQHARLVDEEKQDQEEPPVGALVTFARLRRWLPGADTDTARGQSTFTFSYGSLRAMAPRIVFVFAVSAIAAVLAFVYAPSAFAGWLSLSLGLTLLAIGVMRTVVRVHVGADGLRIHRLLSRPRFVPYASIERMLRTDEDIAIETTDGRWTSFCADSTRVDEVTRFAALVGEHQQRVAEREAVDPSTFTRAGRELGDWMKAVTGAMEANASFRTQAVPAETLWRIVEDGAAPATARAGAALAMRPTLDADGRARLRVLADGSADPRLRVALATLSSEDDDALEGVLARVADRA